MKPLLLIGAGRRCRSIIDSIDLSIYSGIAVLNNDLTLEEELFGIPIIGTDSDASRFYNMGYKYAVIA